MKRKDIKIETIGICQDWGLAAKPHEVYIIYTKYERGMENVSFGDGKHCMTISYSEITKLVEKVKEIK